MKRIVHVVRQYSSLVGGMEEVMRNLVAQTLAPPLKSAVPCLKTALPIRHLSTTRAYPNESSSCWTTVGVGVVQPGGVRGLSQVKLGMCGSIPGEMLVGFASLGRISADEFSLQTDFVVAFHDAMPQALRVRVFWRHDIRRLFFLQQGALS